MTFGYRRWALFAVAGAAFAVAGCSDKKAPAPGTSEGAATDVAATDIKPRAGRWETKLALTSLEVPGMPANAKDAMTQQMSKASTVISCLTPEQAARNDSKFFGPRNGNCDYQNVSVANGKVQGKMTCTQNGMKQTVDMRGTYGADAYDMALDTKGDMGGQTITMAMRVTGTRTGECTGDEPK